MTLINIITELREPRLVQGELKPPTSLNLRAAKIIENMSTMLDRLYHGKWVAQDTEETTRVQLAKFREAYAHCMNEDRK
jgi:hypothetical protein